MEELRKSAIRSAHEYNAEMNAAKRTERRHFWDIQTSVSFTVIALTASMQSYPFGILFAYDICALTKPFCLFDYNVLPENSYTHQRLNYL